MSNQMPTMPSVDTKTEHSLPGESESTPAVNTESNNTVVTPDDKPSIITADETDNSKVNIPLAPKSGIEVIATRKGFYGQMRKKVGDKFTVKKVEWLGEWMKCVDPALERERVKFLKNKKAKK